MSHHSTLWPTNPFNLHRHFIRDCAYNTAWKKFTDCYELSDEETERYLRFALKDIIYDIVDTADDDTVAIEVKAYEALIRLVEKSRSVWFPPGARRFDWSSVRRKNTAPL